MENAHAGANLADLPNELIEKIVPDLKPKTISALKLVNCRFYDFFSQDKYFEAYLRRPEKYYKCDMKCDKNSGGEVVKDIKTGTLGKWKGYLTVKSLRRENLHHGRLAHCETVRLPTPSYGSLTGIWKDLVDEDNEHWLLKLRKDGSIVLINVTNEPKLYVHEMNNIDADVELAIRNLQLLNGQVLCFDALQNGHRVVVLDIVYDGINISLQYKFDFPIYPQWVYNNIAISGKCETTQTCRNLFVTLHNHPYIDSMLRFKDLNTGKNLENINFWDLECIKHFQDVPRENIVIEFHYITEYPNILITIANKRRDSCEKINAALLFNVDKMQPSLLVVMANEVSLSEFFFHSNLAYMFVSTSCDGFKVVDTVDVYRIPLAKHVVNEELRLGKPLYSFTCNELYTSTFVLTGKFAFIDAYTKVHIVTISDSDVNEVEVYLNLGVNTQRVEFNADLMLFVLKHHEDLHEKRDIIISINVNDLTVKEVKVLSNNTITPSFPNELRHIYLTKLSKLVLYDKNKHDDLVIMYL